MKTAACMLIVNPETGLLRAVTRRNSDILCMPGGKVDPGETFLEAAIRETREESGIEVDPRNATLIYEAVCPGEVDYYCQCFLTYSTNDESTGTESEIDTKMVSWDQFIDNSLFREYNIEVMKIYFEHYAKKEYHETT